MEQAGGGRTRARARFAWAPARVAGGGGDSSAISPLACCLVLLFMHLPARSQGADVDTQFIFGFTSGADVGEPGDKELENETTGRSGKRSGSYTALVNDARFEQAPIEDLRIEIGLPLAYDNISQVGGIEDRHQTRWDGLNLALRYRLLNRENAPLALTVGVEAHWSRIDESSGSPAENYGAEFSLAVDNELVPAHLWGAFNLVYDPEATRLLGAGDWQRQATLGALASITLRIRTDTFLGAEVRSYRQSGGFGPGDFAGRALFAGPTTYCKLSPHLAFSGALAFQVSGHAANVPGALDLTNFERRQATLRMEYDF